ncbi:hypothetical protein NDA11_002250 [Ustilago hordei]|uniref:Carboxymuconolactone decarboxylase-like domain-containing protein n=1 Tax=Ustilago hordei TaxID=120017 RepID=I2FTA1_USTHO|nr:hypothetical protein NDA10_005850 [Ustilago hordei]KAJ1572552.1 hypothetical protein NDA12_005667 [Ustilago hordei]KAJ1576164.1 hypothetical protein NDA15_003705 [Ustilago hordei]KAJ1593782.1 hypothetical protein NDA11_002250 [Ustilago hordei]KAJ1595293.1 hypothetical protein NDA14_000183 [Ustilago hordei]
MAPSIPTALVPPNITSEEILHFRTQLSPAIRDSPTWLIVLTCALVSCHHGPESIVSLYKLALCKSQTSSTPSDPVESKFVQRRIQESLVKGSVLFGIPPSLDTIFALLSFLRENNEPLLTSSDFIRSSTVSQPISSLTHPARVALDRIYKHNLPDILDRKMGENMQDLKFLTLEINYGFNLSNEEVIDWRETELVVLAALITQNCRVEVLWHMRGALRAGWTREDVESVQKVAMAIAKRLAVRTDKVPGLEEICETSND